MTLTIVSGAAPGVEQGAIEAAVNLALHWQGWAPLDEIGRLPAIYRTGLQPTSATDPGMLRRLNIQGSDGALVFSTSMVLAGVAAFVDRVTEQMGRAFLHVTLNPAALLPFPGEPRVPLPAEVVERVRAWLRDLPGRVYVTGPSADDVPGIQGAVRDALIAILDPFAVEEVRQTTRVLGLIGQASAVVSVPPPLRIGDPTDCRGAPLDLSPPEGFDEAQRADLDASIREAERDVRVLGHDGHYLGTPSPGERPAPGAIVCPACGHASTRATERHPCTDGTLQPPAPGDQTA